MNFSYLTRFLDALPQLGVPGVDCAVQIGYETVYRHHAGYANREAKLEMQGDERFFLYSSSKLVTCVAALQLYEQGKFLLTDPLYEYIPEFQRMRVEQVLSNDERRTVPAQKPIEIRHLFSMSAGLDYHLQSPAILKVVQDTNGKAPTLEVVRAIASQPLRYEPGSRWGYSLAHDVLGALVEMISGKRFGQYLQENVFAPLGMSRTGFSLTPDMMQQYRRDPASGSVHPIGLVNEYRFGSEYESGGAGLISTVDDYALLAAALANGGVGASGARIISPATIEMMRANQLGPDQMRDFDWPQFVGYGYGLGVRTMVDPTRGGANSPVGEFGWGGAAGSYVLIDPSRKLSLFYTQHMRENMEEYIHPRLRNILYSCLS